MKWFGSSDIKHFVEKFLHQNQANLKDKTVVDIPAGSGVSSAILHEIGSKIEAYDLFPEAFTANGIHCQTADLTQPLPIDNSHADVVLCQEGIEHIPDQLSLLTEFNRILKANGTLLLTTPNYSNLISRTSFLLSESEKYKMMPPNELDSIWYSSQNDKKMELYYGHIFLIGIHKLRLLAKVAGFKIKKIHHTKINKSSLILFPFQYPFILLSSLYAYYRICKRHKHTPMKIKRSVYRELFNLNINPKILLDKQLFIEFEKVAEPKEGLNEFLPYASPPA